MPRVVITSAVIISGNKLRKGDIVEMTSAEITAIGSAGRSVTAHDQLGEGTSVSN